MRERLDESRRTLDAISGRGVSTAEAGEAVSRRSYLVRSVKRET
jgi:hypothetical protein